MKKSTIFTWLTILVLIPLTLYLGTKLTGRSYYMTSTLIIIEILIPFFLAFETRKPQARELVILAVLCALAVASRVAVPIPHFKPVFAVIMISGMAFGPQSGFLVGAMSAFASNFFASQGPWTPWQMLAYGAAGLLAGIFHLPRKPWLLAVFGFLSCISIVGVLLDCSTVFTSLTTFKWSSVLFILAQGLPINISHGISTAVTMLLFSRPLLSILDRIKRKYGMMET